MIRGAAGDRGYSLAGARRIGSVLVNAARFFIVLSSKREFARSKSGASRAGPDFYYHCDAAKGLHGYMDNAEVACAREHRFALFFRNGKL